MTCSTPFRSQYDTVHTRRPTPRHANTFVFYSPRDSRPTLHALHPCSRNTAFTLIRLTGHTTIARLGVFIVRNRGADPLRLEVQEFFAMPIPAMFERPGQCSARAARVCGIGIYPQEGSRPTLPRLAPLRSSPPRQSVGPLRSGTTAVNCSAPLIG